MAADVAAVAASGAALVSAAYASGAPKQYRATVTRTDMALIIVLSQGSGFELGGGEPPTTSVAALPRGK
jgi:hypothetical protein